jgi:hypothetical protein
MFLIDIQLVIFYINRLILKLLMFKTAGGLC